MDQFIITPSVPLKRDPLLLLLPPLRLLLLSDALSLPTIAFTPAITMKVPPSLSLSLCVFLSGHKLISRTVSAQGLFYEYMNFLGGFTKFSKFSGFNDIYSNFLLATQFCCVRRFSFDFWYLGLLQNVFFFFQFLLL